MADDFLKQYQKENSFSDRTSKPLHRCGGFLFPSLEDLALNENRQELRYPFLIDGLEVATNRTVTLCIYPKLEEEPLEISILRRLSCADCDHIIRPITTFEDDASNLGSLPQKLEQMTGISKSAEPVIKTTGVDTPHADRLQSDHTPHNIMLLPLFQRISSQAVDLIRVSQRMRQLMQAIYTAHKLHIAHLDLQMDHIGVKVNIVQENDCLLTDSMASADHHSADYPPLPTQLDSTEDLVLTSWSKARYTDAAAAHPNSITHPKEAISLAMAAPHDFSSPDILAAGVILGQWLEPYLPDCSLSYLKSRLVRQSTIFYIARRLTAIVDAQRCGRIASYHPAVAAAADLLLRMIEPDGQMRISAADTLRHDFLSGDLSAFEGTALKAYVLQTQLSGLRGMTTPGAKDSSNDLILRYKG